MKTAARQIFKRFQSTVAQRLESTPTNPSVSQAPNRVSTWSKSQVDRTSVLKKNPRFLQRDLAAQPQPYAAIELIAKEPVRFIDDRIAVCQGNKQYGQGHPKVYINLDSKVNPVGTCGYCGLRFAQEKHKENVQP